MIGETDGFGDFEFERRFWARKIPDVLRESPVLIIQNYFLADNSGVPAALSNQITASLGAGGGYAIRVRCQISDFDDDAASAIVESNTSALDLLSEYRGKVDFAAITVKGPAAGGTRYEREAELDPGVAVELVLRGAALFAKFRYSFWLGQDGWVIDEFLGANAPLIIAEVERSGPVTDLQIPKFCYTEITDDHRFANDSLALNPYRNWRTAYERELVQLGPIFREDFGANQ